MKILSTIEIIKKYKFTKKAELLFHYIAVSGELPNGLIRMLGIDRNSQRYIFYQSKMYDNKNLVELKKGKNLYGYQLSANGMKKLEQIYPNFDVNLINVPTNDINIRERYRLKAFMYYFLDRVKIDYFNLQNRHLKNCFYSSQYLNNLLEYDRVEPDTISEYYGSASFGLLKLNNNYSLVYVFDRIITFLDYDAEIMFKLITEEKTKEKTRMIISLKTYHDATRELFYTVYFITRLKDILNNEKFDFFVQLKLDDYEQVLFCSRDDRGEQQMLFLKDKEALYEDIKTKFNANINDLQETHAFYQYGADFMLNGYPAIVLCDLDLKKIIRVYRMIHINEIKEVTYYIICFSFQEYMIKELFNLLGIKISIKLYN